MLKYLMPYKKDGFFPRSLVSVLGVDGDRLDGGRGGGGGGGGEAPAAGGRGEGAAGDTLQPVQPRHTSQ